MNILFKVDNNEAYKVPFQYEELIGNTNNLIGSCEIRFFKLMLNTEMTDLPFNQIIYTLPNLEDFEDFLKSNEASNNYRLEISLGVPKLFISTANHNQLLEKKSIDIMTNQFLINLEYAKDEEYFTEVKTRFTEIFITKNPDLVPNNMLYLETQKAFQNLNSMNMMLI